MGSGGCRGAVLANDAVGRNRPRLAQGRQDARGAIRALAQAAGGPDRHRRRSGSELESIGIDDVPRECDIAAELDCRALEGLEQRGEPAVSGSSARMARAKEK